jgi:hypothetical protein
VRRQGQGYWRPHLYIVVNCKHDRYSTPSYDISPRLGIRNSKSRHTVRVQVVLIFLFLFAMLSRVQQLIAVNDVLSPLRSLAPDPCVPLAPSIRTRLSIRAPKKRELFLSLSPASAPRQQKHKYEKRKTLTETQRRPAQSRCGVLRCFSSGTRP